MGNTVVAIFHWLFCTYVRYSLKSVKSVNVSFPVAFLCFVHSVVIYVTENSTFRGNRETTENYADEENQSSSTISKKRGDCSKHSLLRSVVDILWGKGECAVQARREGARYYCHSLFSEVLRDFFTPALHWLVSLSSP